MSGALRKIPEPKIYIYVFNGLTGWHEKTKGDDCLPGEIMLENPVKNSNSWKAKGVDKFARSRQVSYQKRINTGLIKSRFTCMDIYTGDILESKKRKSLIVLFEHPTEPVIKIHYFKYFYVPTSQRSSLLDSYLSVWKEKKMKTKST